MPTQLRRIALIFGLLVQFSRGEALLQYFNTSWSEIANKMPELVEAGYTALWLPPPTKGSGGLSVGYDLWDPFDLGSKDQRNSVRTRYGTEADLLNLMEVAHRFGVRIYFDNIMNHRAFDVPGYNEDTPIDVYPGMVPEDFHLRRTEDGFYRKWDNTRDWSSSWEVQNLGLADLIDIAHETPNTNHGANMNDDHPKYSFIRDLERPAQYDKDKDGNVAYFGVLIDQARAELGPSATTEQLRLKAKEYINANRSPFIEDVGAYLIRAARWKMDRTKADGLRLDAVKHVPDYFFGQLSGNNKDFSDAGYLGGVQWQFNRSRGFSDGNHRDSLFDDKRGRDDAMLFGEHLGQPPGYNGYWDSGMRLVDNDLRSKLNGVLASPWGTLAGLDSPGAGGFAPSLGVMHANSHDSDYAALKEWQHAFYMTRDGIGLVYTDGYYKAATLGESGGAFPRHANTNFLGQFADPRIPNILKIHNDFARGLQQGRWSDGDYLAFERRDNRDKFGNSRIGNAADEITMVAMYNDNTAQGQARGITSSFPSNAYLWQYAEGPNGSSQAGFYKYASELSSVVVPPGGYFIFSWRTPELSTLWPAAAITLYQNGEEVPRITVTRKDGPDGDKSFNPYGISNRGYPVGSTPEDYSYRTSVPVVKGGSPLSIIARADGSAENIMLKLDGGVDLNGTRPTGITDPAFRDHPPGVFSDIWAGLEQPTYVDRQHPEKFAAKDPARCQIGSPGAETFVKTIGGGLTTNDGPTNANVPDIKDGENSAKWIYHNPSGTVGGPGGTSGVGGSQLVEEASDIVVWAKSNSVGAGFKMFVYYTTDGTFPEGAGGIGRGNTKAAELSYRHNQDSVLRQ
jgi:glycosidase